MFSLITCSLFMAIDIYLLKNDFNSSFRTAHYIFLAMNILWCMFGLFVVDVCIKIKDENGLFNLEKVKEYTITDIIIQGGMALIAFTMFHMFTYYPTEPFFIACGLGVIAGNEVGRILHRK